MNMHGRIPHVVYLITSQEYRIARVIGQRFDEEQGITHGQPRCRSLQPGLNTASTQILGWGDSSGTPP